MSSNEHTAGAASRKKKLVIWQKESIQYQCHGIQWGWGFSPPLTTVVKLNKLNEYFKIFTN